jgi:hypothetical protein
MARGNVVQETNEELRDALKKRNVYVVSDKRRGWNSSDPASPSGRSVTLGVGAVFRNRVRDQGYVILNTRTKGPYDNKDYRDIEFVHQGELKGMAARMELGLEGSTNMTWDPADISRHSVLNKLRNKEVLNIHVKEVVDTISIGLGEMPKVEMGSDDNYNQFTQAVLTYSEFVVKVQLKSHRGY